LAYGRASPDGDAIKGACDCRERGHRRRYGRRAFDYFIVEVAPKGGPPLHVHHKQEETIHVLKGRYKIKIGEETFHLKEGGFAYLSSKIPHAFLNFTDEPGEIIVVYTPGGGHKFYEELGPLTRDGSPDPKVVSQLFTKYDMTLRGPPLKPD